VEKTIELALTQDKPSNIIASTQLGEYL
jgi:hypothetical protein